MAGGVDGARRSGSPSALAAVLVAGAVLGGCDQIVTRQPMFGPQDIAVAQLKPGVWRSRPVGCDDTGAQANSATCGTELSIDATSLRPTKAAVARGESDDAAGLKMTYVLASGDPPLVQVAIAASGPAQRGHVATMVTYLALRPVELGPDGQIVQAELWGILCGPRPTTAPDDIGIDDSVTAMAQQPPPPPAGAIGEASDPSPTAPAGEASTAESPDDERAPDAASAPSFSEGGDDDESAPPILRGRPSTRTYFSGMKPAGAGCAPSGPDALRDAAAQSRIDNKPLMTMTWVREPER